MKKASSDAHALLNYLISATTLNGDVGNGNITIPLVDLLEEQDGGIGDRMPPGADDILVRISIAVTCEAQPGADLETDVEINLEEEGDLENEPDTGKNKKSH